MHQQPAAPRGRAPWQRLLFTPPARLGWTFRSHRDLITAYPEPPPDPKIIRQQAATRLATATRSWQRARTWGIRPSLIVLIGLAVLAGCAHAINPAAQSGTTLLTAFILAAPGLGWAGLRYAQLQAAKAADPRQQYQAAHGQWASRAADYEQAELDRLAEVPEWGSAELQTPRTDVYGGTLAGWRSLLTVHGASILARQPLLVADLSGQYALAELAALARAARVPSAEYVLPRDLDRSGLLTRLSAQHLADALAEAIHAGPPGSARTDRAVDVRVLEQLCATLAAQGVTPARLAAAVQVALGRRAEPGLLTGEEIHLIGGKLFGASYQNQIGANLVRLDAFLSGLASYSGADPPAAPPPPAYCTLFAVEPGARTARAELLAALVIQWLTIEVTASTATAPAVVIAGADEVTRQHLERLADACERRGVSLTLLFRHLRDDAISMVGQGSAAFMRLGNHHEAEQAATFLGRHHRFVLSQYTATYGTNTTRTSSGSYSYGTSQSRGSSDTRSWNDDGIPGTSTSGSRTRSRDHSANQNWSTSQSDADGTSWSDAATMQRVYEYAVEPAVLQNLPDNALLLADRNTSSTDLQAIECHPSIITLPRASTRPLPSAGHGWHNASPPVMSEPDQPQIDPRRYQQQWPLDDRARLGRAPLQQPPRSSWQHDQPPDQRE
jgi:hypothetical protein